jgi:transcriptional regulator with XRE-family HTH domain
MTPWEAKRIDQAHVVKTIGERLRAARELCGYSQQKAAKLLGYSNSSKLAKIEAASDTNSVPLWLIPKAAEVYQVSIDFLFGVSECWQRDPVAAQEQQIGQWLEAHWREVKDAQDQAFKALHDQQAELSAAVDRTLRRSKENLQQVERVRQNNKAFDDLRGGAKLLRLLAETTEDAMGLDYELKKLRTLSEAERLIGDILENPRHPANDRKHPEHEQAKAAFEQLNQNVSESRVRRGIEQGSAFEKIDKNINRHEIKSHQKTRQARRPASRVAAADKLLDRGHGRPAVTVEAHVDNKLDPNLMQRLETDFVERMARARERQRQVLLERGFIDEAGNKLRD